MKTVLFSMAAVLVVGSVVLASGDKTSETCVDPSGVNGGSNGFTNGTSSSKIKFGGCKLQLQLKDTAIGDGSVVICLAHADVRAVSLPPGVYGNSVVLRGVASGGSVKMKADLSQIGCGTTGKAISFDSSVACYMPDADYTDVTNDAVNWKSKCTFGMGPLPNPNVKPADDDPAKVNLLGLCQGVTDGAHERITPPTSGEICRQGVTTL